LKGITPGNGYDYDLSSGVFRGRTKFSDGDPCPLVSILESPRSDLGQFAGENGSERSEGWALMIQGWAQDDVENPTDPAYGLMDAVERHLARVIAVNGNSGQEVYPAEYMLQGKIAGITVLPGTVRPPMEQVSSKACFYLPVRVLLVRS